MLLVWEMEIIIQNQLCNQVADLAIWKQTYLALILLHVNLVPKDHKREVLWVMWASLDEELVSPTVESLERLCTVYIVYEYTAVCTTVECYTE